MYVKSSVRVVDAPRREYRGFKLRLLKKGFIVRALVVRGVYPVKRIDSSSIFFNTNAVIVIKKKNIPRSLHLLGTSIREIQRKRFMYLFNFTF
jgi:ribosomal protein L14